MPPRAAAPKATARGVANTVTDTATAAPVAPPPVSAAEVASFAASTDAAGRGRASWTPEEGGRYRFTYRTADQDGVPIEGVDYSFSLQYERAAPSGSAPTEIKAILTGKVEAGGKTYYPKESVGIATGFLIAALHHAGRAQAACRFDRAAICVVQFEFPGLFALRPAVLEASGARPCES